MLGRRGRKERKRLMALLLAGAMVLSGMGISPISVQAEETEPVVEQVSETVSDGNAETTGKVMEEGKNVAAASTEEPVALSADGKYVLETSSLTAFKEGAKTDGAEETAGTDNYFTLIYSTKTKVDPSKKTFDDGYASAQRVNFGGAASTGKNAIKFTTTGAATVKIWWAQGGDDSR